MHTLLEESSLAVSPSSSKCVKNPAYIHLDPEEEGNQGPLRGIVSMYSHEGCVGFRIFIHNIHVSQISHVQKHVLPLFQCHLVSA